MKRVHETIRLQRSRSNPIIKNPKPAAGSSTSSGLCMKVKGVIPLQLRACADEDGNVDYDTITAIIVGESQDIPKPKSVKISHDTFSRYFQTGTKPAQITETIEKALAFYFANTEQEETE